MVKCIIDILSKVVAQEYYLHSGVKLLCHDLLKGVVFGLSVIVFLLHGSSIEEASEGLNQVAFVFAKLGAL